jgi:uncharacterized protein (TIGR03118 family)
MSRLAFRPLALASLVIATVVFASGANAQVTTNAYSVQALVSDSSTTPAASTDTSLVNGWGLSAGPTTPWWVSDNGTNESTLYSGSGAKVPLTVSVPGGPSGTVFNGSASDFVISQGGKSGAARFLFATEGGTILGWTPAVNGTAAAVGADRSSVGAVYKGLATLNDRLYATDFHNGRVDVFDASFNPMTTSGGFKDASVAKGFAPFGIQAIGGSIFVTYAKQDRARHDDVAVPGRAYIDEFTPDGRLVARVVNSGKKTAPLNGPWGLAMAPADFGLFSGHLLVGNFGNGRISAYTKHGNKWLYDGQLRSSDGSVIAIDGLWALAFGNGSAAGPTNALYFAAGPTGQRHGLFGSITAG